MIRLRKFVYKHIIIPGILSLGFFLLAVSSVYFYIRIRPSHDHLESAISQTYRYYRLNPSTKEVETGFLNSFQDIREEGYFYKDFEGNHVLVSKFGIPKYKCTGKCLCEQDLYSRRSSTILSRSLFFLVSASTSLIAANYAKEYFSHECEQKFEDECPFDSIISNIDHCEQVYEENEDEVDFMEDFDFDAALEDGFGIEQPEDEVQEDYSTLVEDKLKEDGEEHYICRGHCVPASLESLRIAYEEFPETLSDEDDFHIDFSKIEKQIKKRNCNSIKLEAKTSFTIKLYNEEMEFRKESPQNSLIGYQKPHQSLSKYAGEVFIDRFLDPYCESLTKQTYDSKNPSVSYLCSGSYSKEENMEDEDENYDPEFVLNPTVKCIEESEDKDWKGEYDPDDDDDDDKVKYNIKDKKKMMNERLENDQEYEEELRRDEENMKREEQELLKKQEQEIEQRFEEELEKKETIKKKKSQTKSIKKKNKSIHEKKVEKNDNDGYLRIEEDDIPWDEPWSSYESQDDR